MDYKYIEQLLNRYWNCETSIEEERILHAFFSQQELPAHLKKYQALFMYEQGQAKQELGEDFDQKMLNLVESEKETPKKKVVVFKANKMTFNYRLRPLYRAAAAIAIFAMIGTAVQNSFRRDSEPAGWDYNAANYQDTYNMPQEAFEMGMNGIEEIQNVLRGASIKEDSIAQLTIKH